MRAFVAAGLVALATWMMPAIVASDESGDGRVPTSKSANRQDVRESAQIVEAARQSARTSDAPLPVLARALRATRSALARVVSPRTEDDAVEAEASLAQHASELRQSCGALRGIDARTGRAVPNASLLMDRCGRLLSAIDEILALADARSRSSRAAALLTELAGAGPAELDPRRATHEPTLRGAE